MVRQANRRTSANRKAIDVELAIVESRIHVAKAWFMIDFDQVEVGHTLKAGMPSVPSLLLVSAEWKELMHDDSLG